MAKVDLIPERSMNRRISHLPGVKAAVYAQAQEIAAQAEANLAVHRDTTNRTDHEVTVSRGRVDSFVNLEGPAPGAVEFGHWYTGNLGGKARFVPGLYIITKAAGLA